MDTQTNPAAENIQSEHFDVVIVGAGFAGMYALYRTRLLGLSAHVIEAGPDVGGTWYWNRYPGARCDVESIDYSYSFSDALQQEWKWTERYASQPEILRYARHVADRFGLRRDISFDTRIDSARFDESECRWILTSRSGEVFIGRYAIMATGPLSEIKKPDFDGLDDFQGDWYHTARWPKSGVDFTGKRVGIIGTGSTGVQLIPVAASQADAVVVFQRTPNFVVPARNRPLQPEQLDEVKAHYVERRLAARAAPSGVPSSDIPQPGAGVDPLSRVIVYEKGWSAGGAPGILRAFSDMITDQEVNDSAADFVRDKIAEIVEDPQTAEDLTPRDHPIGAKRLCVGTDYFETYNRDSVRLVNVRRTPITCITPGGIETNEEEYELDVIVFAIGFDAITGALDAIDIRGRDGRSLADQWAGGPQAFLGMTVSGFPNLFLVNGPGSPAVLGNALAFLEYNVEWIVDCVDDLNARGVSTIEAMPDAEEEWAAGVDRIAAATLYPKANSWFIGANVDGKPRRFLPYAGGFDRFQDETRDRVARGYDGFLLDDAALSAATTEPATVHLQP